MSLEGAYLRIPTVCVEVSSFRGAIGAEHFYGMLRPMGYGLDGRRDVTLFHRLTKEEADYLNKKDRCEGRFFRWKTGMKTERFNTETAVITEARNRWRKAYPKAIMLIEGSACVAQPQTVIDGPRILKTAINKMVAQMDEVGHWEGDERAMNQICHDWAVLMARTAAAMNGTK